MFEPENTFGTITVYCDGKGCSREEVNDGFDGHCDFKGTADQIKEAGWKIVRDPDTQEFYHYCRVCVDDKNY